jgi:arylsulfatase A-like enzyme
METVDDETVAAAIAYIRAREKDGTPWFVWWNGTRMHFRTHVSEERRAMADKAAGKHVDEYAAGMIEHDMHVGQFLDLLDELGIADEDAGVLLHRQRAAHEHLAGCGLVAVPG